MDRGEILRQPVMAGFIGGVITYLYQYFRARINGTDNTNSFYIKPAFLVGVLVFFIVKYGQLET